ncbi:hypothetical protein OUZ56_030760 [Daphnia magna]|uniref:Fibronectin type-III domain-containing protein n=1 Tax=Daphnia magna TaxID=35525 RepID=A0ABQ9ZTI7_9CRUS|nr:hypothetical protein OUZ56_030760 [Daphnia magna]
MAGLIEKYRGAAKYLSNRASPLEASQVLICRAKSRKVSLDLQTLMSQDVPHLVESKNEVESSTSKTLPTHVVVGVTYGAEAYCVLALESDEDAQEKDQEYLSEIASKMEAALSKSLDFYGFKDLFNEEERKQLTRIKCRLYVDLQTSPFQEGSVFSTFKQCHKLIEQVRKGDIRNKKIVPIAVLLCPLKAIMGPAVGVYPEYQDVDSELLDRCCRTWEALDSICAKSVAIRTKNKKANHASLRQFEKALDKYKQLVQKAFGSSVVEARQTGKEDEIERVAKIAENHAIFKPSRLERWLRFKQAEYEMSCKIGSITEIECLANEKELEKNLAVSFNKKYSVVLRIPPLDELTNKTLENMKEYVDSYKKLTPVRDDDEDTDEGSTDDEDEDEEDGDDVPWHMLKRYQKPVLARIQELADHLEKNQHIEKHVEFLIVFGDAEEKFGCRYSVYETDNLLKDNLSQLPVPPTDLRIHVPDIHSVMNTSSSSTIRLAWRYADLGLPCLFLVEYLLDDGTHKTWNQKKTTKAGETQIAIPYAIGSSMKFRVAADTCIGRSEFSDIIHTNTIVDASEDDETLSDEGSICSEVVNPDTGRQDESVQLVSQPPTNSKAERPDLTPPTDVKVGMVGQSTAELRWKATSAGNEVFYRVLYWQAGEDDSSANELKVPFNESGCQLENLQPETTYRVHIVTVSNDGGQTSAPSECAYLTTIQQDARFAKILVKRCSKIGVRNGMDLFAVPLVESSELNSTVERFSFGNGGTKKAQNKTILVMGASGAGKTTLINGMINYIFNVEWEDTFRFQLIHSQLVGNSQGHSQTRNITAYDIHHAEGFRVPFSLTIVDTPGYGDSKGLDRDEEITEMIRKFFEDKNGIQDLDVIGFVAQASLPRLTPTQTYIFDSVLSIFGKDVKENIDFLLTFADSQVPPILEAITETELPYPVDLETGKPRHHKFNNSGFFCSSLESGGGASNNTDKFKRFFWNMGMENFRRFFIALATMETKSLSLTKDVLDERKRLEVTVDGLQPLIKIGLAKMEELRKIKQKIAESQVQIGANQNFQIEVETSVPKKVMNRSGHFLTNCNKCYMTCHHTCVFANDSDKARCSAMNQNMPEENRTCRICPQKCIWNMHANQPYSWEYVLEKQILSSDAIKEKYEKELKKKLTAEEVLKALEKEVDENNKTVLERVNIVSQCIQQLDAIALRPNPFSTPQYIDLIIDAEQRERRQGYNERIQSLKKLRTMAVTMKKIKDEEDVISVDSLDDQVAHAAVNKDEDDVGFYNYDDTMSRRVRSNPPN